MSEEKTITGFECAVSDEKHILQNPIELTCNHFICQKCLLNPTREIKCKICGQVNRNDLSKSQISNEFQLRIRKNLHGLLVCLEEQITNSLADLKSKSC
jgi:hypothetical protein